MYDVAIIGAGVWGVGAAHAAVRSGTARVLLLEQGIGPAQESSAKSGGIVTDLLWHPEDRAFVQQSRVLYQEAAQMSDNVQMIRRLGMVILAEPGQEHLLRQRKAEIATMGIPAQMMDERTIRSAFPTLDRLAQDVVALYMPLDWHVNPTAYALAALDDARKHGLKVETDMRVEALEMVEGGVAIHCAKQRFVAARVLVAAGTWSRKIVQMIGADIAMRPYRVQLSSVHTDQEHNLPMVWHLETDVYMVPEGPQELLAGDGTQLSEFDPDAFMRQGDRAFEESIAERLMSLSSIGDSATLRTSWAGLVGATPDRRPLIGRVAERVYVACGDNGFGVMRGPAIGSLAAAVALDETEVPHLRPDRFAAGPFPIRSGFTLEE